MSVLYEKGTPAWDIGQILTTHAVGLPSQNGQVCDKVQSLRNTALKGMQAADRLSLAEKTPCTCGSSGGQ